MKTATSRRLCVCGSFCVFVPRGCVCFSVELCMLASDLFGATTALVAEAELHPCIFDGFCNFFISSFSFSFLLGCHHGADCYLERAIIVLHAMYVAVVAYFFFRLVFASAGAVSSNFFFAFFLVRHSVVSASSSFNCMSCKCSLDSFVFRFFFVYPCIKPVL